MYVSTYLWDLFIVKNLNIYIHMDDFSSKWDFNFSVLGMLHKSPQGLNHLLTYFFSDQISFLVKPSLREDDCKDSMRSAARFVHVSGGNRSKNQPILLLFCH